MMDTFKHILLDEAQDSEAICLWIEKLAEGWTSDAGDPMQSIYRFLELYHILSDKDGIGNFRPKNSNYQRIICLKIIC